MRSTEKTVLMVQHAHDKKTATYPVSVHVNKAHADQLKTHVNKLVEAGDADGVKALLPAFKLTEDGKLPTSVKWATLRLPYAPAPAGATESDDEFDV
jgi:hypothetical protein